MAEQAVNSVTAAVAGELTNSVFSVLIQRYGKDAATSEKLQRLEMLLIKIHSAVEAFEKHTTVNSWLLRWRDKLKEAASRGDEELARFPLLVKDADANQKQGEAASSSTAAPATAGGAHSFPKKSLSDIVQGIRSTRKMMFWSVDDDMERLNKTLARLEKLSPDIGVFIRLLHLEALPKVKVDQKPYRTTMLTKVHGPTKIWVEREKKRMKISTSTSNPSSPPEEEKRQEMLVQLCFAEDDDDELRLFSEVLECGTAVLHKEQQFTLLHDRLQAALVAICKAVELEGSRDLEDLDWLAYWAGILREAKEQGSAVLGAINAGKTMSTEDNKESIVEFDPEKDELGSFVHRLEGLASDVEYFYKLVDLCALASYCCPPIGLTT